jgi:hypothetical protein
MRRNRTWMLLAAAATIAVAGACAPQQTKVVHTPNDMIIQSGVIRARQAKTYDQYIRGVVEYPHAFSSDHVMVQVYPLNGPGKVWVMDANSASFTYFILATMINIPRGDGEYLVEPRFYDGDLKWIAVGY